jgi:hypothetical protein
MKNQQDNIIREAQKIDTLLGQINDEESKDRQIADYRKIINITSQLDNSHD